MKKKNVSLFLAMFMLLSLFSNSVFAKDQMPPNIHGKSAITLDMDTGEIIYAKSIDNKMYPASTTKLMTALLLAENKKKDDLLKYTEAAKKQPEYSINKNLHAIDVGETITAEDVMDGLLLYSGNDIAYVIADNVGGNVHKFANMMNNKAKDLNLRNSNFITPNGLHDDNHYTTAYDLSIIGRAAFKNPWVRESMNKKNSTIRTSKGTVLIIENRNKLLGEKGCIGGKTGYTAKAGRCLVALFERNGRKIVGVVMNSIYDRDDSYVFKDMEKIIDWSYNVEQTTLTPKDTLVKTEKISYKPFKFFGPNKTIDVPLLTKDPVTIYDNEINKQELKKEVKLNSNNIWKLASNDEIGTLTIKEREVSKNYKLYSSISKGTILKQNIILYTISIIVIVVTLLLIVLTIKTITKRKNRNRRSRYI